MGAIKKPVLLRPGFFLTMSYFGSGWRFAPQLFLTA